jgi:hypothetical protein
MMLSNILSPRHVLTLSYQFIKITVIRYLEHLAYVSDDSFVISCSG